MQFPPPSLALLVALASHACSSNDSSVPADTKPLTSPNVPTQTNAMSPSAPSLSLDDVATYPKPGTVIPSALAFTNKGRHITYLFSDDGSLHRSLYSIDIATGSRQLIVEPIGGKKKEVELSAEEKLQRERKRERGLGVTSYSWSKTNNLLVVPMASDLYVKTGLSAQLRKLVDAQESPVLSPQPSPDGRIIAYVKNNDIFTVRTDVAQSSPQQITHGGAPNKIHGLAEYIAQEEMDRHQGFWWSQDSNFIAFTEIDQTHIPTYQIMHQGKDDTGPNAQEEHGYPFAGGVNARVRLGVTPATGDSIKWMDLGDSEDIYLARVHWTPAGELWAEIENREQTQLDLVRFDLRTGKKSAILQERSDIWINLNKGFRALENGDFLWISERSGFAHIYLYNGEGTLIRQLTSGDWPVDKIVGVDEKTKNVYFVSGKGDPTQAQLYEVGFAGASLRQITQEPGTHQVLVDNECKNFVDTHSSTTQSPRVYVRDLQKGNILATIFDVADPKISALPLPAPELVTLPARDNTILHAAIFHPPSHFKAPFPTVVSVYGGPHVQQVANRWDLTVDMRAQYLRNQGYLVIKLDNRGSARRGLNFEGKIKHDMGRIEILDQVDGVHWLVKKGLTDPNRVGMVGWSYGGYMSAMALARAPKTFRVAIAGAPVTHWDGYDTHYTERYMGTPKSNPKGYQESSVMHHAHHIQGKLMLIHGLIDENVHFRHSARLINALIDAEIDYELLLFPSERHMPRSQKGRVYMESRISKFLHENLFVQTP